VWGFVLHRGRVTEKRLLEHGLKKNRSEGLVVWDISGGGEAHWGGRMGKRGTWG